MALLKRVIAKLEDVEEGARPFYLAKGDTFELQLDMEGIKTQADVDAVQKALTKERTAHAETKTKFKEAETKLASFDGLDPEEVHTRLAEADVLKSTAGGTADAAKVQEAIRVGVESQLKTKVGPLEREIKQLKTAAETMTVENTTLKQANTQRTIDDSLRSAALEAKVNPAALDDFLAVARGNFEVDADGKVLSKDGIDPKAFVADQKAARPHFWPVAQGAGAGGNAANGGAMSDNPFTAKGWNVTKQGELIRTDRSRAETMAKTAGTTIGGPKPVEQAAAAK